MSNKWILGRAMMVSTLLVAFIWGSMLVMAACNGRESSVISTMFDAVCFLIFTTLAVLVGGKAWKTFAPMKWGNTNDREQL